MDAAQLWYLAALAVVSVAALAGGLLASRDHPLGSAATGVAALVGLGDLFLRGAPGTLAEVRDLWRSAGMRAASVVLLVGVVSWCLLGLGFPRRTMLFLTAAIGVVGGFALLKPVLDAFLV